VKNCEGNKVTPSEQKGTQDFQNGSKTDADAERENKSLKEIFLPLSSSFTSSPTLSPFLFLLFLSFSNEIVY
jgi:hypothetical protein